MKIEILFPELCSFFGETGNILILEKTFGNANVIKTSILQQPVFLNGEIDLVYLGSMSENSQLLVLKKLLPHRKQFKKLIDAGMKALFTGNAMDILGKTIIEENGKAIKGMDFFNFETIIKRNPRLNCVVYGFYGEIPMVGNKTQFTQSYPINHDNYFFKVKRGMGINKKSMLEGFKYKGLVATNMTGPLLVFNPGFANDFLGVKLPYQELLEKMQLQRINDIKRVKSVFY